MIGCTRFQLLNSFVYLFYIFYNKIHPIGNRHLTCRYQFSVLCNSSFGIDTLLENYTTIGVGVSIVLLSMCHLINVCTLNNPGKQATGTSQSVFNFVEQCNF